MDRQQYFSYSWHQSHDQATVLLMVPHDVEEEDMLVTIDRNYLLAGVRGQVEIVKGRLYGNVDVKNSMWQIEPRTSRSRMSARERTTSSSSTASTHSSYAFISDPEISSSFAASLESGQVSDAEDLSSPSPALSSPTSEQRSFPFQRRSRPQSITAASRPESPGRALASSYSSVESLQTVGTGGRLLTVHLEKEQSMIWPSLVVGPHSVPSSIHNSVVFDASHELEHQYNMDPTSLVLIALELLDIRKDREEAFECFLRAWHLAHVPTATMKLATHYLPLHTNLNLTKYQTKKQAPRGTTMYYLQCIGGPNGLAKLYLEAGMLHLDGAASSLAASTSAHSSLSSLRLPMAQSTATLGGTEAWRRDRAAAVRFFDHARALQPDLDIPVIPPITDSLSNGVEELEMPSIDINVQPTVRRRRKKEDTALFDDRQAKLDEMDNAWYLYLPGLVGAGTALVLVGVIGALSFSTWSRRNQGA